MPNRQQAYQSDTWVRGSLINGLRNGGQERWSRGTSVAIAASVSTVAGYAADGWCLKTNANQASTVARQTGITNQSQYAGKVQRNSGQTGTGVMVYEHAFETFEVVRYRGGNVSLRCSVLAGANMSGTIAVRVACGTGAEGRRGAGFTGETTLINQAIAPTTVAQSVQLISSVVVPTSATQMSVSFEWTPSGTAGADDSFTIDDLMFVGGGVQLPFLVRPDSEQACQRWVYAVPLGDYPGLFTSGANAIAWIALPVDMRAAPVLTHGVTAIGSPSGTTVGVFRFASGVYVTSAFASLDGWTLSRRSVAPRINSSGGFSAGVVGEACMVTLPTDGLIIYGAEL